MELGFQARIVGPEIHREIVTDMALSGSIFCCLILTPTRVVSGGALMRQVAGYTEVALPDLKADVPHDVVLADAEPSFTPRNRARLPLVPQSTRWVAAGGTVTVGGFACDAVQFGAVGALAVRRGRGGARRVWRRHPVWWQLFQG